MTPPRRRGRRAPSSSGFTLVEIMLAMAVLVLLAGGMAGSVRATLQVTDAIQETQRLRQNLYGLLELCQATFLALPPAATLVWNDNGNGNVSLPEIALRNAPGAFPLGTKDLFFGEIALTTRTQNNGAITVGIEYRTLDPQSGTPLPDPVWLPLTRDVKTATWSFYDSQVGQWQTFWTDTTRHPSVAKLTLVLEGSDTEWTQSFWLPPLQQAGTGAGAVGAAAGARGPGGGGGGGGAPR